MAGLYELFTTKYKWSKEVFTASFSPRLPLSSCLFPSVAMQAGADLHLILLPLQQEIILYPIPLVALHRTRSVFEKMAPATVPLAPTIKALLMLRKMSSGA